MKLSFTNFHNNNNNNNNNSDKIKHKFSFIKFLSILTWYSKFKKWRRMQHHKSWNRTPLKYPRILPGFIDNWPCIELFYLHRSFIESSLFCSSYELLWVFLLYAVTQNHSIKARYSNNSKYDKIWTYRKSIFLNICNFNIFSLNTIVHL